MMSGSGDCVIPADLKTNVKELHEYMFEDYNFVPSQTVQSISETVLNNTGITANDGAIDTDKYNETAGATGSDAIGNSTEGN
jgi:hypothetical protein